jgi:predicted GH43/DUF377 family glycosyl hydrolase
MFTVTRSENNPLISPVRHRPWEATAAFNGCPVVSGRKTYLVYRAMSEPDLLKEPHLPTSVVACGASTDGIRYEDRHVLVSPDREFDLYGCEDPRVTKFGGTHYIFYTALGGYPFTVDNIKVAVALSKDLETVEEKHLVTPFNAKAMALFPDKIGGKMAALLTINTDRKPSDICYAEFDSPEEMWSPAYWEKWQENVDAHKLHIRRQPDDHLELGAPPVKTDKGWLVVYAHIQRYGKGDQVFGFGSSSAGPRARSWCRKPTMKKSGWCRTQYSLPAPSSAANAWRSTMARPTLIAPWLPSPSTTFSGASPGPSTDTSTGSWAIPSSSQGPACSGKPAAPSIRPP